MDSGEKAALAGGAAFGLWAIGRAMEGYSSPKQDKLQDIVGHIVRGLFVILSIGILVYLYNSPYDVSGFAYFMAWVWEISWISVWIHWGSTTMKRHSRRQLARMKRWKNQPFVDLKGVPFRPYFNEEMGYWAPTRQTSESQQLGIDYCLYPQYRNYKEKLHA